MEEHHEHTIPEGARTYGLITEIALLLFTGVDARFPNMNQTKHCWQNYVDYHKCINAKGEDFAPCRQVPLPTEQH